MIDPRIQQALNSNEPVNELRSLAQRLLADGQTREAILESMEHARRQLRQADRETDEDAVMDVMEYLVGWCSPHMKLAPDEKPARNSNGPTAPGTAAESPPQRTLGSSPQPENTP